MTRALLLLSGFLASCNGSGLLVAVSSSFTPGEQTRVVNGIQQWWPVPVRITDERESDIVFSRYGDSVEPCLSMPIDAVGYERSKKVCIKADWIAEHPVVGYDGLVAVATHEMGHVWGLEHIATRGAVMFPNYGEQNDHLTAADRAEFENRGRR